MKILNTLLISLLAYSASAQLGIGTSSPTSPLDIETNTSTTYLDINNTAGDGDPAINFQLSSITTFSLGLDDGDADKFKIGTTAIGTNTRLTIDGSGNVGIGTTWPQNLLDVRGEAHFGPNLSEGIKLGEHEIKLDNSGTAHFSIVNTNAAGLQIQNTGSSAALGTAASNVIMTFEIAGDVGIGTTNPTATLEVDGDAIFNNSGAAVDFRVEGDTDTELLFIDASADRIGISTTGPSHTLDVRGEARFGPNLNEGVKLGNHEIKLLNAGVGHFSIVNTDAAGLQIQTTSSSSDLGTAASNVIMTFETGGDVGIGMTNPSVELDVTGDIEYTGTITDVSDRRLKENFSSIDSILTKIMKIEGLSYNMINDSTKRREYGVIAQDVQKVFPEMVTIVDPDSGYLGVAYIQLVPVLLEATKAQQAIIEAQKKEIASEKAENESQKQEIETIKAEASSNTTETAQKLAALEAKLNALLLLNSKGAVLTAEN
jgi:hypothetical protein